LNIQTEKIIDGKKIADQIITEIKSDLEKSNVKPGLALIIAGNNPASESYVKMKGKKCGELGYYSVTDKLPENVSEDELLTIVEKYNNDDKIHGILIQLPLPKQIHELKILEQLATKKMLTASTLSTAEGL